MRYSSLISLDSQHVWHPYSPMPHEDSSLVVDSAQGIRLHARVGDREEDNVILIDGMSSWWSTIHGYSHPSLVNAVTQQAEVMAHVMFGGITHEPAVRLCQQLVNLSPPGLEHVFLCDSGSVSVEVAIKIALQYWRSQGDEDRTLVLTWRGGYHGDTLQPMSVCDPVGGMHEMWHDLLPERVFVSRPPCDFGQSPSANYCEELRETIARHASTLAAIIVEPIVQGAGGMRFHHPEYLRVLRQESEHWGIPLIFDEIATGFGRTGKLFAAEHAGISPDIMCVGKALTGGMMTMAATLCTPKIAQEISLGKPGLLAHGPTFMGNPLAASAALASLELLSTQRWKDQVSSISRQLRDGLSPALAISGVADVRILGAIGVIELDSEVNMSVATQSAINNGVWLRPFRNLIYCMPPYICEPTDIKQICDAMVSAARASIRSKT